MPPWALLDPRRPWTAAASIGPGSAVDYWAVQGVLAVGGSWIAPESAMVAGEWAEVRQRAAAAVDLYRSVRGAHG